MKASAQLLARTDYIHGTTTDTHHLHSPPYNLSTYKYTLYMDTIKWTPHQQFGLWSVIVTHNKSANV